MKRSLILDRRRMLVGAAMIPLALAVGLQACTQAQLAAWIAAEQSLGQEFTVVAPELVALGVDPKATVTIAGTSVVVNGQMITVAGQTITFSGIGALVQNLTAALSAASTAAQGQSTLIAVMAYINALVPVIWPVVGPMVTAANPGAGLAIGLIVASLPAIEQLLLFTVDFTKTFLSAEAQQLATLAPPPPASAVIGRMGAAVPLTAAQRALVTLMQQHGYPSPYSAQ